MNKLLLQAIRKYGKPIRRGGTRPPLTKLEPPIPVRRRATSVMRLVKHLVNTHIKKITA